MDFVDLLHQIVCDQDLLIRGNGMTTSNIFVFQYSPHDGQGDYRRRLNRPNDVDEGDIVAVALVKPYVALVVFI